MAWLNATPEVEQQKGEAKRETKSRRRQMIDENIEPEMPELTWGRHLIDYLFEFGPTMPAGMGSGPLTGTEIKDWQELLGIEFHPWESRLLRRLSSEYLDQSRAATKRDCPPPFGASPALMKVRSRDAERNLDLFLA